MFIFEGMFGACRLFLLRQRNVVDDLSVRVFAKNRPLSTQQNPDNKTETPTTNTPDSRSSYSKRRKTSFYFLLNLSTSNFARRDRIFKSPLFFHLLNTLNSQTHSHSSHHTVKRRLNNTSPTQLSTDVEKKKTGKKKKEERGKNAFILHDVAYFLHIFRCGHPQEEFSSEL